MVAGPKNFTVPFLDWLIVETHSLGKELQDQSADMVELFM